MILTKKERHKHYKAILTLLKSDKFEHKKTICGAVVFLYGIELDSDRKYTNFKEYFPELWNKRGYYKDGQRKNEDSVHLWDNTEERIDALEKCIEETKPKKRKV